eukprot:7384471-Prymnesium_polylepis.2
MTHHSCRSSIRLQLSLGRQLCTACSPRYPTTKDMHQPATLLQVRVRAARAGEVRVEEMVGLVEAGSAEGLEEAREEGSAAAMQAVVMAAAAMAVAETAVTEEAANAVVALLAVVVTVVVVMAEVGRVEAVLEVFLGVVKEMVVQATVAMVMVAQKAVAMRVEAVRVEAKAGAAKAAVVRADARAAVKAAAERGEAARAGARAEEAKVEAVMVADKRRVVCFPPTGHDSRCVRSRASAVLICIYVVDCSSKTRRTPVYAVQVVNARQYPRLVLQRVWGFKVFGSSREIAEQPDVVIW